MSRMRPSSNRARTMILPLKAPGLALAMVSVSLPLAVLKAAALLLGRTTLPHGVSAGGSAADRSTLTVLPAGGAIVAVTELTTPITRRYSVTTVAAAESKMPARLMALNDPARLKP